MWLEDVRVSAYSSQEPPQRPLFLVESRGNRRGKALCGRIETLLKIGGSSPSDCGFPNVDMVHLVISGPRSLHASLFSHSSWSLVSKADNAEIVA
jgi:hypothetical protein